jgi:hypothetical protein
MTERRCAGSVAGPFRTSLRQRLRTIPSAAASTDRSGVGLRPRRGHTRSLRQIVVKDPPRTAAIRLIGAVERDGGRAVGTRCWQPTRLSTHLPKRASPAAVAEIRVGVVAPDVSRRAQVHHRSQHCLRGGAGRPSGDVDTPTISVSAAGIRNAGVNEPTSIDARCRRPRAWGARGRGHRR